MNDHLLLSVLLVAIKVFQLMNVHHGTDGSERLLLLPTNYNMSIPKNIGHIIRLICIRSKPLPNLSIKGN